MSSQGRCQAQISQPSCKNRERTLHCGVSAEQNDLSPAVHSLYDGVTRLCPSADVREREFTLLPSKSAVSKLVRLVWWAETVLGFEMVFGTYPKCVFN